MVDAQCIVSKNQTMTFVLYRAEIVFWKEGETFDGLEAVVRLKAILQAGISDTRDVRGEVERTVGFDEVDTVVLLEQLPEQGMPLPTGHQACRDLSFGLKSRYRLIPQQAVQWFYHLHVRVHVDAALVVKGIEAHDVRHKGKLPRPVSLLDVWVHRQVEVVFVPLINLVVGAVLPPRLNALHRQRRQRIPPEPAVMNYFRYHWNLLQIF